MVKYEALIYNICAITPGNALYTHKLWYNQYNISIARYSIWSFNLVFNERPIGIGFPYDHADNEVVIDTIIHP